MEHFYVTLPSDSSRRYYPQNTIAKYRTKLAAPIQLSQHEWEVGLGDVSYPIGLSQAQDALLSISVLILEDATIHFPVQNYRELDDLITV
jgi:hypothetical protein